MKAGMSEGRHGSVVTAPRVAEHNAAQHYCERWMNYTFQRDNMLGESVAQQYIHTSYIILHLRFFEHSFENVNLTFKNISI